MAHLLPDAPALTVRGACPHDCPDTCALLTTVVGDRAVAVHGNPGHGPTDGVLCVKVTRYAQRTHHPQRLLTPLRRVGPKGAGQFEPVDWDTALRDIAARLRAIAADDPQGIAPYSYAGTMGLAQGEGMAARFFNKLGASRLDRTICSAAGEVGLTVTLGGKVGLPVQQFAHSRLIVIWGTNPIVSNLHFWRVAQAAKRNGARLVCIDPRRSETAVHCHTHLGLRPGTDGALALALMHEWTVNGTLDQAYIDAHTLGWAGLRSRALAWPPERAAAECGIDAQAIRDLAADMAASARAGQAVGIRVGYGVQRVRGGGNAVRLIAALPALIGAWRQRGGGLLLSSSGWGRVNRAALQRPDLLAGRQPRVLNMSTLADWLNHPGDAAFGPPVRALIVYNSNPAVVAPDANRVRAGLCRDDLFTVVLEHFQTDTADCADYVLPATTQLEHFDVVTSYGHTDVVLNEPAIAPLGQAWPNTAIFRALAWHMGYTDPAFSDDDQTLCRQALGAAALSQASAPPAHPGKRTPEPDAAAESMWTALLRQGWASWTVPDVPFATGGFPTASGRCEFYSQTLDDQGLGGWADYVPNAERPWAEDAPPAYPLALNSPPPLDFLNSSFVNVDSLRARQGQPTIELHPSDAAPRGVADGDPVRVFNARGAIQAVARINGAARPGVVNALGLWWPRLNGGAAGVNALTRAAVTDLGGGATFFDCAVELEKI